MLHERTTIFAFKIWCMKGENIYLTAGTPGTEVKPAMLGPASFLTPDPVS